MPDISSKLSEIALKLARQQEGRAVGLEVDLLDLQKRQRKIEAEANMARGAAKRSLNFRPGVMPNFECPGCWIRDEQRSTLTPVAHPDDPDADILRCRVCGSDWDVTS